MLTKAQYHNVMDAIVAVREQLKEIFSVFTVPVCGEHGCPGWIITEGTDLERTIKRCEPCNIMFTDEQARWEAFRTLNHHMLGMHNRRNLSARGNKGSKEEGHPVDKERKIQLVRRSKESPEEPRREAEEAAEGEDQKA